MDNNECISCIKDGTTGVCRDIKDKTAREEIENIKKDLNVITGVNGGHLATDEDINNINTRLDTVKGIKLELLTHVDCNVDELNKFYCNTHMERTIDTLNTENYETISTVTPTALEKFAEAYNNHVDTNNTYLNAITNSLNETIDVVNNITEQVHSVSFSELYSFLKSNFDKIIKVKVTISSTLSLQGTGLVYTTSSNSSSTSSTTLTLTAGDYIFIPALCTTSNSIELVSGSWASVGQLNLDIQNTSTVLRLANISINTFTGKFTTAVTSLTLTETDNITFTIYTRG